MKKTPFAIVMIASLVLGSCAQGSDGLIEYTDPERLSLLKLPGDWHLYESPDLDELSEYPFLPALPSIALPTQSLVAFDGAPSADLDNLSTDLANAPYPIGTAAIRTIGENGRDYVSRALLSLSVLDHRVYPEIQDVMKEDFSFGDGFEGVRRLMAYTAADGQGQGVAYLISVTNPADDRMYSVVAGCSLECFTSNQEEIERVVDSWLVNTKG